MASILKTDNMKCWWCMEQLRFSYTAHENKNWHNHFAKLIGYMYKLDYQHSLCLSNSTSRYIPNRNSILKDMYKNVHSSIIYNSPQMGTTQMSATIEYISRWWYIHTMEYHTKIKLTTSLNNKDNASKHNGKRKEPVKK